MEYEFEIRNSPCGDFSRWQTSPYAAYLNGRIQCLIDLAVGLPSESAMRTHSILRCVSGRPACGRAEAAESSRVAIFERGWDHPDDHVAIRLFSAVAGFLQHGHDTLTRRGRRQSPIRLAMLR